MKFVVFVSISGAFNRPIEAESGGEAFSKVHDIVKEEFGSGYNVVQIELKPLKDDEE